MNHKCPLRGGRWSVCTFLSYSIIYREPPPPPNVNLMFTVYITIINSYIYCGLSPS